MALKGKTITVFGGTGFIGRYVVARLARLGARVIIPTREIDRALPLKTAGDVGQIVPIAGSIWDDGFVAEAVCGADGVINLIGILYESGKNSFAAVHGDFPARLGRAATEAGVKRLVHLSAIGADDSAKARYAKSKAVGEKGVREAFPSATILRPSIVIGPEDGFFNRFAQMALFAPALPLIGGGKTRFQPIYVGDVADAVIAALTYDGAIGKTFEIGGPAIFNFRELMELMLKETGRKRCLVSLPFWFASIKAFFLQLLPNPLLTMDQVELLKRDNVWASGAYSLRDLGITPTAIESVLPTYLDKYKAGGRFGA